MKAVVFAYHDMGCTGTQALLEAGYDIAAIFTHPDTAGENNFFGSVARIAAERGIPVYAPDDVNHPLWVERIRALAQAERRKHGGQRREPFDLHGSVPIYPELRPGI